MNVSWSDFQVLRCGHCGLEDDLKRAKDPEEKQRKYATFQEIHVTCKPKTNGLSFREQAAIELTAAVLRSGQTVDMKSIMWYVDDLSKRLESRQ